MCGMGHQVLANDVRDAAREQVESMGAQFVAVDAQGIAGAISLFFVFPRETRSSSGSSHI